MKNLGLFLVSLWLITDNLLRLTSLHFPYQKIIIPAVALTAGIILFLYILKIRLGDIGLFLLSLWLILRSSLFLFHITFPYSDMTVAILGISTGFFLLIRK
jgi:hypothetical protein